MGSGVKKVHVSEKKFFKNSKRSLIAIKDLKKGEFIKRKYFKSLRPLYKNAIGINLDFKNKRLKKNILKNQYLTKNHI